MSRVVHAGALALEALLLLAGVLLAAAGGALLYGATQRDQAGYVVTSYERVSSAGCAVVARADLGVAPGPGSFLAFIPERPTLVRVRPVGPGALVVATAPRRAVEATLSGHAYDELTSPVLGAFTPSYRVHEGTTTTCPRAGASWTTTTGTGTLTMRVPPGEGLAVVLLRADGRPGLSAEIAAGIDGGWFLPLGVALGVSGVALVVTSSLLLKATARRARPAGPNASASACGRSTAARPVVLTRPRADELRRSTRLLGPPG